NHGLWIVLGLEEDMCQAAKGAHYDRQRKLNENRAQSPAQHNYRGSRLHNLSEAASLDEQTDSTYTKENAPESGHTTGLIFTKSAAAVNASFSIDGVPLNSTTNTVTGARY